MLRQVLRAYFVHYRFQHPTASDFFATVEEVTGRKDLEPYLVQAFQGTDVLDYSVDSVTSEPADSSKNGGAGGPYHTSVMLRRNGTLLFPVKLEVAFADGSKQQAVWDGNDRWARFSWDTPSLASYARLDPDRNVLLDTNSFNNSYSLQRDLTARSKLTNYWVFAQQLLAQWLSFLV